MTGDSRTSFNSLCDRCSVYLSKSQQQMIPNLRVIQIIHLAFCLSILLFAFVVVLITYPNAIFAVSFDAEQPATFIAPIFAVGCVVLSNFLFSKVLSNIEEIPGTSAKLVRYQTAFIVKCAPLEAAALFNLVTVLITQNLFFILFAGIPFVALWFSRPTKEKMNELLKIQDTDSF